MSIEERVQRALRGVDRIEPSDDLWSRVVHSIDEDRAHRRRVITSTLALVSVLAGLVLVGALSLESDRFDTVVHRPTMELLELVGLLAVVATMGPAIRRFGRHYAEDLFPTERGLAARMLRLLDVAYYLVFAAYILLTTQFEFRTGVVGMPASFDLAQQLHEASVRLGGLLLLMGALHAVTLAILPFVALVHNSTRRRRPLPRWLTIAGTIVLAWLTIQVVAVLLVVIVSGAG